MKYLLALLIAVSLAFAVENAPAQKQAPAAAKQAAVAKPAVKEQYEAGFENIMSNYSKKVDVLEKTKKDNQESLKKIAKTDSTIGMQKDSALTATKAMLKSIYDGEIAKVNEQEETLKQKKK